MFWIFSGNKLNQSMEGRVSKLICPASESVFDIYNHDIMIKDSLRRQKVLVIFIWFMKKE